MKQLENIAVILASKSPRRKDLLHQAGFSFDIITSDVEEKVTKTNPQEVVEELSYQKGKSVFEELQNLKENNKNFQQLQKDKDGNAKSFVVIGADTVVCAEEKILGKPKSKEEAYQMLDSLQGKTHQVYTGVSLFYYSSESGQSKVKSFAEKTDVSVFTMSSKEIESYIATKDCYDKAGGYGIQGQFAVYIKGVCGDYNNVVGLPIARLYHELIELLA